MRPLLFCAPVLGKAGKLYSQIGNDFTVVRNLAASFRNASGLLEFAAVNVPRIEYPADLGCPYLLREDGSYNSLLRSNDFANASWQKSGTPTITSGQQSPTQTPNQGWILGDNDPTAFQVISQITTKNQNRETLQFFMKKTVGTPSYYPGIAFYYSTGGSVNNSIFVLLNTTTGAGFTVANNTIDPVLSVEDWGEFWRFKLQCTDASTAQPNVIVEIYPAASLNGTTLTVAATGNQIAYGFMIGEGSYIETLGTAVTRPADVIQATDIAGATTNTFVFEDGSTTTQAAGGTITVPVGKITYIKQD